MRTFLTCAAMMFLAFGCTVEPTPPATQDQSTATSVDEAQLPDDAEVAGAAPLTGGVTPAINCANPPTCALECQCDKQGCLAAGNSLQVCSAQYTACFRNNCL